MALLLADLVGPQGAVVGVEIDPAVLATARKRAEAAGMTNVSFQVGDMNSVEFDTEFDALVGRPVLMHLRSPAFTLRKFVTHLRPGGIVAFHEFDMGPATKMPVEPSHPLIERAMFCLGEAFNCAGFPTRMGLHLSSTFLDAELPAPQLYGEANLLAGPEWANYDWPARRSAHCFPLF